MWKVEPNVNMFSQQTTTDNIMEQTDPCVFPAKAGDTKMRKGEKEKKMMNKEVAAAEGSSSSWQ